MHYYQFNIADYRKDTIHLSMLEHGAYRQLLDWLYLEQTPIPKKTEVVFRRLSAKTEDEKNAILAVLNDMFFLTDDGYIQHRVMRELDAYKAKAEGARRNGKLGGRPKKTKEVISGLSNETEEKANLITHKPINSITNNKNNTQKNEFFADIDSQLLNDYMQVRKAKRAPKVSKTVYDAFVRECKLAQITITDALRICVERNWVGFKADWYIKQPAKQSYQDGITIASKSIFKPEHLGHLGYEKEVKDE